VNADLILKTACKRKSRLCVRWFTFLYFFDLTYSNTCVLLAQLPHNFMPQEMYDVIAAQSEKGLDDDKNTSIIVAPNFTRQEVKTLLVSGSFQNTGVVAGSSASQPLPLASETPVLSSKIQVLVDSMSEEDGQKFKESCSQNDLRT